MTILLDNYNKVISTSKRKRKNDQVVYNNNDKKDTSNAKKIDISLSIYPRIQLIKRH